MRVKMPHYLLTLYGLAGVTALAYEVLWSRMLTVLLGASNIAVAMTVSTFMLGLGLGSLWGARYITVRRSSVLIVLLALVEALVAVYALILPVLLQHVFTFSVWLKAWSDVVIYSAAGLLLLMPTILLGLAFPLALRVGANYGLGLHSLYGYNAGGGMIGALLPLLLLPWLGWAHSLQSVAVAGLLLAVAFVFVARQSLDSGLDRVNKPLVLPRPSLMHLLCYACVGAGAMMLEVVWIRLYGMVLLRTEYVMALILAVFLFGIAGGSLIAPRVSRSIALRWLPLLVLVTGAFGLLSLPLLSQTVQQWEAHSLWLRLLQQGLLLMLLTLPVTLALGAWLPLLAKTHASDEGFYDGAWLYGVNSAGAFAGGLLACFVFIPWLGSAACWLLALMLMTVAACYWGDFRWQRAVILLPVGVMLLMWKGSLPAVSALLPAGFADARDLFVHEDALAITHVVEQGDGQRVLMNDLQRLDASTEATAVAVQKNEARLPMLLHPHPQRVLFLGLGTGITASAALDWPNVKITAVELSAGAIIAAEDYFSRSNGDIQQYITIVHDDARRFLMMREQHYDVIVGDLFHPDLIGRAQLLSLQQFERAKAHLNKQGVFCQWLALNQFDIDNLQVVMRTFARVFPQHAVFVDGFRLALVGFSDHQPRMDVLMRTFASFPAEQQQRMVGGESISTWLARYWGRVEDFAIASQGLVQDEWWPVIEYHLPYRRYHGEALVQLLRWLQQHRLKITQAGVRWQSPDLLNSAAYQHAWVANSLLMEGQLQQLAPTLNAPEPMRFFQMAYRNDSANRWASFAVADAMLKSLQQGLPAGMDMRSALERILTIRPDHEQALRLYCQQSLTAHLRDVCRQKLSELRPYPTEVERLHHAD